MAAPTTIAWGSLAGGTGDVTPTVPGGTQLNDVLLLMVESYAADSAPSTPSGYSLLTSSITSSGTGTRLTVFWKRHSGSESNPTIADTGDHQVAIILPVRGCRTSGNPWDAVATDVKSVASTSLTWPSVTTTVNEALVVYIATASQDLSTNQFDLGSTGDFTNATLTGTTHLFGGGTISGNGGGFGVNTGVKEMAGATGTSTQTMENSGENAMVVISMAPVNIAAWPGASAQTVAANTPGKKVGATAQTVGG